MAKTKPSAPTTATTTPTLTLADFKPRNSRLVLIHPYAGEVPDAWIELASATSDTADKARRAVAVKNKNVQFKGLTDEQYLEQVEENELELAARLITAWNEAFFEGALTVERAAGVLRAYPLFFKQVQKHLNDEANFYTA